MAFSRSGHAHNHSTGCLKLPSKIRSHKKTPPSCDEGAFFMLPQRAWLQIEDDLRVACPVIMRTIVARAIISTVPTAIMWPVPTAVVRPIISTIMRAVPTAMMAALPAIAAIPTAFVTIATMPPAVINLLNQRVSTGSSRFNRSLHRCRCGAGRSRSSQSTNRYQNSTNC